MQMNTSYAIRIYGCGQIKASFVVDYDKLVLTDNIKRIRYRCAVHQKGEVVSIILD